MDERMIAFLKAWELIGYGCAALVCVVFVIGMVASIPKRRNRRG